MAAPVRQCDLVFPANPQVQPYFELRYNQAPAIGSIIPGVPANGWTCVSDCSLELGVCLFNADGPIKISEGINTTKDFGSDKKPWRVAVSADCKGLNPSDYYRIELVFKPIGGDPFGNRFDRLTFEDLEARRIDLYKHEEAIQVFLTGGTIGLYEIGIQAFNYQTERIMRCTVFVESTVEPSPFYPEEST